MAWICVELDRTLLDDPTGEGSEQPTEGSVEAMTELAGQGHRITVFTTRFRAMPDSEKQRLKEQIEQELQAWGFPPMDVWTGSHKPGADLFIDNSAVTFDGDWPLAMVQTQMMLEERGLAPAPQPGMEPQEPAPEPAADPNSTGVVEE